MKNRMGTLYYDNFKDDIEKKVERLAGFYFTKHGARPNWCCVREGTTKLERVGDIEIKPLRHIMNNHYWMGVNV